MKIVVAGITTEVGKTVVSAVLVEMWQAEYWKPVQTGEYSDIETVKKLAFRESLVCHPEAYCLKYPYALHQAAALESVKLDPKKVVLPSAEKLVIEMAGGLCSPFDHQLTQLDLYAAWDCEWILVSKHYLGSINHTILTAEMMKRFNLNVRGLIFNGETNPYSEEFILNYTKFPLLGRLQPENHLSNATIKRYAEEWKKNF